MADGPCLGCGFEIDENGDLQVVGVSDKAWPYVAPGHTDPDAVYCDPDSNRLWAQPWNLPWGRVAGSTGSGQGVYANGIGPQNVCPISVTLKANRCYMIQGTFNYNADVRTIFDVGNIYFGAVAGGCIYNVTDGAVVLASISTSTGLNYANSVTLNYYYENNTGADITKVYAWRSLALGLINARPASSPFTGLVALDVGPRL